MQNMEKEHGSNLFNREQGINNRPLVGDADEVLEGGVKVVMVGLVGEDLDFLHAEDSLCPAFKSTLSTSSTATSMS
jgi:hypothetical protein